MSATFFGTSTSKFPSIIVLHHIGEKFSNGLLGTPRSKSALFPDELSTKNDQVVAAGMNSKPGMSGFKRSREGILDKRREESMMLTLAAAPAGTSKRGCSAILNYSMNILGRI
jgi:hypothetical protein